MGEDKNQLLNYAIYASIFLGTFWVLKYLLVIIGGNSTFFSIIANILSFGTPLLLFYYLVRYKTEVLNNKMGFWHGVQFSIVLFFFASIFEAVIVFVHVKWINPVFISNIYDGIIEVAKSLNLSSKITTQIAEQPLPTAFSYVFSNVIMADVFLGLLLSLFLVPLAIRYNPQQKV